MSFTTGFKKIAADPNKRWSQGEKSDFARGAMQGGPSMAQAWGNLKSGLGFGGGTTPPPAPKNVGLMGS